jgi:hypothetical protein
VEWHQAWGAGAGMRVFSLAQIAAHQAATRGRMQ